MTLLDVLVVAGVILVGFVVVIPLVRRQRRANDSVPRRVWVVVALLLVLAAIFTAFGVLHH